MRRLSTLAAMAAIIFVAIAIGAAFRVMGSPTEQRLRRFDDVRVGDLSALADAVELYWSRHHQLPGSLDDIVRDQGSHVLRRDPVTQRPYEYQIDGAKDVKDATDEKDAKGANGYTLCAQFDRASRDEAGLGVSKTWAHGSGRHCFARAVRGSGGTTTR